MLIPGIYNVYENDGKLMKWGDERVRAEISLDNRVRILTGTDDHQRGRVLSLPPDVANLNQFDNWISKRVRFALKTHVADISRRLARQRIAYQVIIDRKREYFADMLKGKITTETWVVRLCELNHMMEISEELQQGFIAELMRLNPESLTQEVTFYFMEV